MFLIAIIALIIGAAKVLIALSVTEKDFEDICTKYDIYNKIDLVKFILILDGIVEIFCGLYII